MTNNNTEIDWLNILQKEFGYILQSGFREFREELNNQNLIDPKRIDNALGVIQKKCVDSIAMNVDKLEEFYKVD